MQASDCDEPTIKPDKADTEPPGHAPVSAEQDAPAAGAEHQHQFADDNQGENAAPTDARGAQAPTEQSAEERLAEELSAVKAENEQLRVQLDKIHAMLTGQVKLMNDAVRNAVPRARALVGRRWQPRVPPANQLAAARALQVQRNHTTHSQQVPHSWSTGALSARILNWGIGQRLSHATSLAFARPETKLGWLARSAVAVVGVYALGRYGKAPALRVVSSTKGAIVAAGTTVRSHLQ